MREPNLLVTFHQIDQRPAMREVMDVLEDIGEEDPIFTGSRIDGLFQVQVSMNPKEVTREVVGLCRENPRRFRYTYHWIPVERWCDTDMEQMHEIVRDLAQGIDPEERWRMTLNKRFYHRYSTLEFIEKLAAVVEDRPHVDLENPDKIIQVEVIRTRAGFSLLEPNELVSVNDIRKEIEEEGT